MNIGLLFVFAIIICLASVFYIGLSSGTIRMSKGFQVAKSENTRDLIYATINLKANNRSVLSPGANLQTMVDISQ